jgi:hypothetical protein
MRSALRSRLAALVALGAALAASTAAAQARGTIFREVTVGFNQPITLGRRVRMEVRPLLVRVDEHRLRLREGAFSGAAEITVQLDGGARVRCMDFAYPPGFSYEGAVRDYAASLGAPVSSTGNAGAPLQARRWEDPRTAFTLTRRGAAVHALLCDRALTGDLDATRPRRAPPP